jgi:hypothetical protein
MGEKENPTDLKLLIQSVVAELKDNKPADAHVHWSIKVFGSAVLVIVFSVVIGLFQNIYRSSAAESPYFPKESLVAKRTRLRPNLFRVVR